MLILYLPSDSVKDYKILMFEYHMDMLCNIRNFGNVQIKSSSLLYLKISEAVEKYIEVAFV